MAYQPTKSFNFMQSIKRVYDSLYWGRDVSLTNQMPLGLSGEFIQFGNAAVNGVVNLIGTDSMDRPIVSAPLAIPFTLITASGAIAPRASAQYVITKAGVAAMTLAAPTTTTDDGEEIIIYSNTAFAHTVTATGLLQTGTASVNVATFAAFAGARLVLRAYAGKWMASGTGITFS